MYVINWLLYILEFLLLALTNNAGGVAPPLKLFEMDQQNFRKSLVLLSAS